MFDYQRLTMMFVAYLPIIKHDVLEINHLMIFIDFPSYKPTFTSGISEYPLEFQRFQRPRRLGTRP